MQMQSNIQFACLHDGALRLAGLGRHCQASEESCTAYIAEFGHPCKCLIVLMHQSYFSKFLQIAHTDYQLILQGLWYCSNFHEYRKVVCNGNATVAAAVSKS